MEEPEHILNNVRNYSQYLSQYNQNERSAATELLFAKALACIFQLPFYTIQNDDAAIENRVVWRGTNDNSPRCAQPGNADLKILARGFVVLGEITRRSGANQWQKEFGPAERHLEDFINEIAIAKEDVYLLLIGPQIHRDTYNSIRQKQIEGLNIIPLTFGNIEKLLESCILTIGLKHINLRNLFEKLSQSIENVSSISQYERKSLSSILEWRESLLRSEQLIFVGVKGYRLFKNKGTKLITAASLASELALEKDVKSYFTILGKSITRNDVKKGLITFGFACDLGSYERDPILAIVPKADIKCKLNKILDNINEG